MQCTVSSQIHYDTERKTDADEFHKGDMNHD